MASRNGQNMTLGKLKEDLKIETFEGKWCTTFESKMWLSNNKGEGTIKKTKNSDLQTFFLF